MTTLGSMAMWNYRIDKADISPDTYVALWNTWKSEQIQTNCPLTNFAPICTWKEIILVTVAEYLNWLMGSFEIEILHTQQNIPMPCQHPPSIPDQLQKQPQCRPIDIRINA